MKIGNKLAPRLNRAVGAVLALTLLVFGGFLYFIENSRYRAELETTRARVAAAVEKHEGEINRCVSEGRADSMPRVLEKLASEAGIVGVGVFDDKGQLIAQNARFHGGHGIWPDSKETFAPFSALGGAAEVFTRPFETGNGVGGHVSAVYSVEQARNDCLRFFLKLFFLVSALLLVAFFAIREILNRLVILPSEKLKQTMDRIRPGDANAPVFETSDDLAQAVRRLDFVADRYAEMKRELTQLNTALEEKVRERTRQSDEANRAKSAFLANMSHELRTPLNAILGFTNIMSKKQDLPGEIMEQLAIVRRSGEHLLLLINDVLDLSKVEAGQMDLHTGPMDLHRLLWEMDDMFRMKAIDKKLELEFDLDENLPRYILTDELKLRQILINFIDNAVKFTDVGGIFFRAKVLEKAWRDSRSGAETVRFTVEDTGSGISPEEKKNLFKAFVQTRSGQESRQGTGLGLAISYRFIKLMDGEIQVQSAPGKGSVFSFTLPLNVTSVDDPDLFESVKYRCLQSGRRSQGPKSPAKDEQSATAEKLGLVSPDVLRHLENAARKCDMAGVEKAVDRIRETNPALAESLSGHAANFDYDVIVKIIAKTCPGERDSQSGEKAMPAESKTTKTDPML